MRLTSTHLQALVRSIFDSWKVQNLITFKQEEDKVFARAVQSLQDELKKEQELNAAVEAMLVDLERQHGGSFQRHKMQGLLKQKLAKERKVIL